MGHSDFEKELKAIGLPRPREEVDRRVVERALDDASSEKEAKVMFPGSSSLPLSPVFIIGAVGAAAALVLVAALLGLFGGGGEPPTQVSPPVVADDEGGKDRETTPVVKKDPPRVDVPEDDPPAPKQPQLPVASSKTVLAGVVRDRATGRPVEGVTVACRCDVDEKKAVTVRATTNASGQYTIEVRRGTALAVSFAKPGFARLLRGPIVAEKRLAPMHGDAQLEVPAKTLPQDHGRVVGVVRDAETGRPVPNATVAMCLDSGGSKGTFRADQNGRFAFDWRGSEKHRFAIVVRCKGLAEASSADFVVLAGETTVVEVFARRARTVIRGTVKDAATGAMIVGAKIEIADWPDAPPVAVTDCGPAGYEIETRPGMCEVRVSAPGYQKNDDTATVRGGETHTIDFALKRIDAGIAGTCVDARTGRPVRGVHIDVYQNSWPAHRATSDRKGRFALAIPSGTYRVLARKDGFGPLGLGKVEIGAGGTTDVPLRLHRENASISGRVVDRNGKTVAALAEVFISAPALGPERMMIPVEYPEVTLDRKTKRFEARVAPGEYRLEVRARGYLAQEMKLIIGDGEKRYLEVALKAAPRD